MGRHEGRRGRSSYVLSVFKTFGFVFPRNTGQQNGSVGNITNTEAMSEAEKLSVLAEADSPVLLYKSGRYDLSRRYK